MGSTNAYDIGDRVRCTGTFVNQAGEPADPTTITAKVLDPLGNEATFSGVDVIRESLGVFYVDIDVDLTGLWAYRFQGTGAMVTADEEVFYVERSAFDTGS